MVIEDEPADAKKREKTEEERMADYASLVKEKIESLPGEGRWMLRGRAVYPTWRRRRGNVCSRKMKKTNE